MRSLLIQPRGNAWIRAVALLERWLGQHTRLDSLIEEVGRNVPVRRGRAASMQTSKGLAPARPVDSAAGSTAVNEGAERARCQHLLFGTVRHLGRLEALLGAMIPRTPRIRLRAVLLIAAFELLEAGETPAEPGQHAKIVHHAVAQAKLLLSPAEVRLINAVLRKLACSPGLSAAPLPDDAGALELARFHSHPEWLVQRWLAQFGSGATRQLLQWNQMPPLVYARWRGRSGAPGTSPAGSSAASDQAAGIEHPGFLQPSPWAGFFVVSAGQWSEIERLLAEGTLYLQDPATLLAPGLLDPKAGETVADLCAAPGGKSLLLADLMEQQARQAGSEALVAGQVVAIDLPDARRIDRLKANLAKARKTDVVLVQADVLKLSPQLLKDHNLPAEFPAILLDVPCSNTGVMRHRVDVKWRLRASDIGKHAGQQLALLVAAARFLAPGGRLVYSTCSLEPEENEGVVEAFLGGTHGKFALEQIRKSRPWENGCDGAAAFLLRRNAG
jgi:16S rRNA (cytosine967-C5)-methyltransferase